MFTDTIWFLFTFLLIIIGLNILVAYINKGVYKLFFSQTTAVRVIAGVIIALSLIKLFFPVATGTNSQEEKAKSEINFLNHAKSVHETVWNNPNSLTAELDKLKKQLEDVKEKSKVSVISIWGDLLPVLTGFTLGILLLLLTMYNLFDEEESRRQLLSYGMLILGVAGMVFGILHISFRHVLFL